MSQRVLTFLTRPGCELCADAEPRVVRVGRRLGFATRARNIDDVDELVRHYGLRIPVVLAAGGEVVVEGRWTTGRLVSRLIRLRWTSYRTRRR